MKLNFKAALISIVIVTAGASVFASQTLKAKYVGMAHMTANDGEEANCSVEVQIESSETSIKVSRHINKCDHLVISKRP